MRAAEFHTHAEAPRLADRPEPTATGDEQLLRVSAVAITPLDLLCASGVSYFGPPALPYVPGVHGVGHAADGRRYWFTTAAGMAPGDGAMAEVCAVDSARLLAVPDGVPDALAAALGWSAIAAAGALERGGLTPGETVVVLGAGGVVGQVAVQLARLGGAARTVGVVHSQRSQAVVRDLGVDAVVSTAGLDETALTEQISVAADGPVDLVVDPLWGLPAAASLSTLRAGGRLVNLGDSAGPVSPLPSATIRSRSVDIRGYTNLSRDWAGQSALLAQVFRYAEDGLLTVHHEVRPLDDVTDAWQAHLDGSGHRRVVLVP